MAGDLNRVSLIGRLGADPEIKTLNNGGKVCNLRIATSESWKDKASGEKKERTEWHSVVIWSEGIVGVAEKYCNKGDKVMIEGQLQTRKWQDQNGNDRYSTEIVLQGFDAKLLLLGGGQGGGERQSSGGGAASGASRPATGTAGDGFDDDEIPF